MTWNKTKNLILSDLFRYSGTISLPGFLKHYYVDPGFKYSFWMRICAWLRQGNLLEHLFFYPAKFILRHFETKFGISISDVVTIGSGLYIGHFGGIVVHDKVIIGCDCNLSNAVTIGVTNRGERKGTPVIGDRVYIGPGAKIIGNICIGNDAAIGANCVVTKDVPEYAVVVGIPGRVISFSGSDGYINNTGSN